MKKIVIAITSLFILQMTSFAQIHTLTKDDVMIDKISGSILSYISDYDSISIPPTIDNTTIYDISAGAFFSKGIVYLELPSTIKTIGVAAFAINNIDSLIIPDNVEYIGENAFQYNGIRYLRLLQNINHIGYNAFIGNDISTFTIPNSLDTISGFQSSGLRSITIPNAISVIDSIAFSFNHFDKISISDGVRKIGFGAFGVELTRTDLNSEVLPPLSDDPTIDSLEIPSSVTDIGDLAFCGQRSIRTLILHDGLVNIGRYSFFDNRIDTLIIPSTVEHIGYRAFFHNEMDSLHWGSSVTYLGEECFAWNHLLHVEFPPLLDTLPNGCFIHNRIKEVDIPSSLSSVEPLCFAYNNIRSVNVAANSVSEIDSAVFMNNAELSSVSLGEGVTTIDTYAFAYCCDTRYDTTRISNLYLPTTLRDIKPYAFYYTYLAPTQLPQYNSDHTKKLSWYKYDGAKDNIIDSVYYIGGANFALLESKYGFFAVESDIEQEGEIITAVQKIEDSIEIFNIYDINGRLIGRQQLNNINLPSGIYIIRNEIGSRKILIE